MVTAMLDDPTTPAMPQHVRQAFAAFPDDARAVLLAVRGLVFAVAAEDTRIGALTEALKWGEPAYLTAASRSGSTLRLGVTNPGRVPAIFVNCRTTLAADVRDRSGAVFGHEGARALLLPEDAGAHADHIRHAVWLTLTYHLRRRAR